MKPSYLTWGCADELACRLRKTLYCGDGDGCYDASSTATLTDMAVSMYLAVTTSPRRPLTQRYASSITRHLHLSPCSILMGILYSERLRQSRSPYLDHVSSSDLYVVSLLIATKLLTDEGEDDEIFNDEWAEAAGLAVTTVNRLEREFLQALDWKAHVHPDEFLRHCADIESRIALKQALARGWFSYTDLSQLLLVSQCQLAMQSVMERVLKVISGCVLVYGVSISMMASSIACLASPPVTSAPPTTTTYTINQTTALPGDTAHYFPPNAAADGEQENVFSDADIEAGNWWRKPTDDGKPNDTILSAARRSNPQSDHHYRKYNNHPTSPFFQDGVDTGWHGSADALLCFEMFLGGLSHQTRLTPQLNPSRQEDLPCQRSPHASHHDHDYPVYDSALSYPTHGRVPASISNAGCGFESFREVDLFSPLPKLFGIAVS